jgi:hypothetical protein
MIRKNDFNKILGKETVYHIIKNADKIREGKIQFKNLAEFKNNIRVISSFLLSNVKNLTDIIFYDIKERIFEYIDYLFSGFVFPTIHVPIDKRLAIFYRVQNLLNHNFTERISVDELANRCCCSRRSLEYSIRKVTTFSPSDYLKIRRIHQIRSKLFEIRPGGIGSLLTEFGVVNKGRFSKDYYHIFGEYPKDTLKNFR